MKQNSPIFCPVCKIKYPPFETLSGRAIRPGLLPFIVALSPGWTLDQDICLHCLNKARSGFVEKSLVEEIGGLSDVEKEVIESIRNHELVAENPIDVLEEGLTFGEKASDKIAAIGGSWSFIIGFSIVLLTWIIINTVVLWQKPFDPYPFILLNLVLSALAAIQAPIIMMSQNRQDAKDRKRTEMDYKTDLKAELEIRHLHIKMDQLLTQQWHRLLEIQQVQTDLLNDLLEKKK
jgi:uncharacterized membrane protein